MVGEVFSFPCTGNGILWTFYILKDARFLTSAVSRDYFTLLCFATHWFVEKVHLEFIVISKMSQTHKYAYFND